MAISASVPIAAATDQPSADRWSAYSAIVLAICVLGWAFDIYEQTIMQLVTPLLIKEWGITPATMGYVTTIARWVGLIGLFLFPALADLYGRKPGMLDDPASLFWAGLAANFLITGSFGAGLGYTTELFPTQIRGTAV